jgi:hypothetical protein
MTDIDDSEALDDAADYLELTQESIKGLRAYASNLRQQLAYATAKLERADAYITSLKACADSDAGCMRSLRDDLDAATAKLERLEKAARDALTYMRKCKYDHAAACLGGQEAVDALSPSPASPPQGPAAPAGPRFQVTAEEFTDFFAFWMKGSTKALLMDELNRILAQRPAQPVQEPASPPAGAGVVDWVQVSRQLDDAKEANERALADLAECRAQLKDVNKGWKAADADHRRMYDDMRAERDRRGQAHMEAQQRFLDADRERERLGRELAECREELGQAEAQANDWHSQLDENHERATAIAAELSATKSRAEAAESALAVERETVERLRASVRDALTYMRKCKYVSAAACLGGQEAVGRIQAHPSAEPITVGADPSAPKRVAELPAYWDERRKRQGKPDTSRCAAELRVALEASAEPKPWPGGLKHDPKCTQPAEFDCGCPYVPPAKTEPKPGDVVDGATAKAYMLANPGRKVAHASVGTLRYEARGGYVFRLYDDGSSDRGCDIFATGQHVDEEFVILPPEPKEPAKQVEVERIERLERAMRVLCEGGYFYEGARFENALAVLNEPTSVAPPKE